MAFAVHHTLILIFGILGNVFSVLVYFAPVPTFIRIYKKKSTESFHSAPYAFALLSSVMWIYYALLKSHSHLIISINLFGCVMETIFLAIFVTYASGVSRIRTTKLLVLLTSLFTLVFLLTFFLFKGPLRVTILGWISVIASVSVFAAPFTIIKVVIRTKSVEYMPFALSFFLTLTAMTWFTYGMLLNDYYVALPNVLGFIFSVTQMGLYAKYRKPKPIMDEKLPTQNMDIKMDSVVKSEPTLIHVDSREKGNQTNMNYLDKGLMGKSEV